MKLLNRIKNIIIKSELQDINDLRKMGLQIGRDCEIYNDVSFGSEPYLITIGNHVRITRVCKLITHDGGIWVIRTLVNNPDLDLFGKIKIGNNVHIGMNSIIMPGVTIGDNCIVGCGAVVTKDMPSGEIWAGIPARKIKTVEEYYTQHKDEFDNTKQLSYKEKKRYLHEKYNVRC